MNLLLSPFHLSDFDNDYQTSRNGFFNALESVPAAWQHHRQSHCHPLLGPSGENLYCDNVLISANPEPKHLLVLQSATHGVEGFHGSALQKDLLRRSVDLLELFPDNGFLLIHALNPWGFAWQRRGDHKGIDLNRNFVDFSQALPANPGYDRFATAIEAGNPVWQADGFQTHLADLTQGQYRYPQGIFYGGRDASWSRRTLEEITSGSWLQNAEKINIIDVHSGLGPYGYGEIINDHPLGSRGFEWAKSAYGDNALSAYLGESSSAPKVGLLDFHWHQLIGERGCFTTLEFGTYSSADLIRLLIEEQIYQNGLNTESDRDLLAPPVRALKHFFYPEETSWQEQVLFRGRQAIDLALRAMTA
ncbi:DUF2817 domain-containing protein [Thiomicrorhabdus sp.]|uniref:DUF2817 domain-containing protein n=1 Tax=Thiomicrorhabdus sp. TaxID=2039724 RepID=UPI0029C65E6B|nr:DUF2817 domain-containing protein [Thiomicrorhabdus sp.]